MHPGLLDVLHDPGDPHVVAVTERVDVDLDRILQEAIEVDRRRPARHRRVGHTDPREVPAQTVEVVDDLHRAAAEHVAGPHEQREADGLGLLRSASSGLAAVAYGGAL